MASPVGHTLSGIVIYSLVQRLQQKQLTLKDWKVLLPFLFLPNLPDIDFLIGYVLNADPHTMHGGVTHSLGFILLVSVFAIPFRLFGSAIKTFFISFALIGSHLLLDMTSGQLFMGGKGYGVMLFYPFSEQKVHFPLTIFWGPKHRTIEDLFSIENVHGIFWEILIFIPIIFFLRKRQKNGIISRSESKYEA